MHFEQILVDWKNFLILGLSDKVYKIHWRRNFEFLLGVLVLLHVKSVFNFLVVLDKLSTLRGKKIEQKAYVGLQIEGQQKEKNDGQSVWRLNQRKYSHKVRVCQYKN